MKNLILIISVFFLVSCSSKDDPGDVNDDQFGDIVTILPQGTWSVSSYMEGSSDRTMDFESFVFTFDEDKTVTATNDLFSESGTWNYQSSLDSPSNDEKLILTFGETTPFNLIEEDWIITSANSAKVALTVASGNNGEVEVLVFSKI